MRKPLLLGECKWGHQDLKGGGHPMGKAWFMTPRAMGAQIAPAVLQRGEAEDGLHE